ncbi:hypothetical protein Q8A67_018981 [Cirrhinus molitorella]|uniref:Uncharacterized protein n=1 Tax=Cirrhinus molitorella TaxID=172907 RepID=A0AA88THX9_9TELE|nr:hypothetical protein Q8A67_018981 [Cirrhinus molitorella]
MKFTSSPPWVRIEAPPALITEEYATLIPDQYTGTDGRTDSPQLCCHSQPQTQRFPVLPQRSVCRAGCERKVRARLHPRVPQRQLLNIEGCAPWEISAVLQQDDGD